MSTDIDLTSNPHLTGIFTPIQDELTDAPCEVLQGRIPAELAGSYVRNGPNPRFPPIGSYTYPLDGDGMIHAVAFARGGARYSNRYVRTPTLTVEERAGHALWGGVLTPGAPSASDVGPALAQRPYRYMPDVNVVRHAGQLLALAEGDVPFALTDQLATIGPWDFDGVLAAGMCAHPKVDPVTGEMIVFRYGVEPPYLTWAVIGRDGTATQPPSSLDIDGAYMIHDCAITARHLLLFVCPFRFDLTSKDVLAWEPRRGTRIAVVSRDARAPGARWFETDAFWVWHFANAHEEEGDRIVVEYPYWAYPGVGGAGAASGGFHRTVLDLRAGTVATETRDDRPGEFPRIDDRRLGRAHRYLHAAGKDPSHPAGRGVWNALRRYDLQTGDVVERRTGGVAVGEAVFVPRAGGNPDDESDGYLMTYLFDGPETRLLILPAGAIDGEPVATLRMRHRIPSGLHGTWLDVNAAGSR